MAITDEIMKIAREKGYTGQNPQKISDAVNALTEALGGEPKGGLISDSIATLSPSIGGGGGSIDIANYSMSVGLKSGPIVYEKGGTQPEPPSVASSSDLSFFQNSYSFARAFIDGKCVFSTERTGMYGYECVAGDLTLEIYTYDSNMMDRVRNGEQFYATGYVRDGWTNNYNRTGEIYQIDSRIGYFGMGDAAIFTVPVARIMPDIPEGEELSGLPIFIVYYFMEIDPV